MTKYCCYCGKALREPRDFTAHWLRLWECPAEPWQHNFLEIGDSRLVFPLLDLSLGVKEKMIDTPEEKLKLARSRIKEIDYKTVSIVGFEQTLLGIYKETSSTPA